MRKVETTYWCDKCGAQIEQDNVHTLILRDPHRREYEFEFCPTCAEDLIHELCPDRETQDDPDEWGIENAPEESSAAPDENDQKERNTIDRGKVMALHDAGWKNKDIAYDMHLEPQQVAQVIFQKRKNKKGEMMKNKDRAAIHLLLDILLDAQDKFGDGCLIGLDIASEDIHVTAVFAERILNGPDGWDWDMRKVYERDDPFTVADALEILDELQRIKR